MIMRKIVCYDLHDADANEYNDLYIRLKNSYNGYRITESAFVVFSNLSNKEILNDLYDICEDKNISLIVADLPAGVHTYNIKDTDKWFNK